MASFWSETFQIKQLRLLYINSEPEDQQGPGTEDPGPGDLKETPEIRILL